MADWVQMGRVWVKVEPEATAVVQNRISGWKWTRDTDGVLSDSARPFRSAEDAMVDYDAIYDPQPKPIEAVDRGPDWSFWKSEDGTRAALRKDKNRLLKLIEIIEAAERGEVIEYRHSRVADWMEEHEFNPVEYSHLTYRVAKPKRGAK